MITTNYEIKKNCQIVPEESYKTFNIGELENTDFIKKLLLDNILSSPIVTIIHHTDMDGICAAQIMKEYLINVLHILSSNIGTLPYNYEKNYDFNNNIDTNCKFVIFVDLSPKFTDFENIITNDLTNSTLILWIDHHIGSVREIHDNLTEENSKLLAHIDAYVDINGCGTKNVFELTKESIMSDTGYKFGSLFNEDAIQLVDIYDRWLQTSLKQDADALNRLFYDSAQLFIDSEIVNLVLHSYGNNKFNIDERLINYIKLGHKFLELEKEKSSLKYLFLSRNIDFTTPNGKVYKSNVIWGDGNSSLWGDHIKDYDVVIRAKKIGNGKWSFSFYTIKEDIDCAEIARQYDGSGHRAASGCMTNYNILNKKWKC